MNTAMHSCSQFSVLSQVRKNVIIKLKLHSHRVAKLTRLLICNCHETETIITNNLIFHKQDNLSPKEHHMHSKE